MKEVRISTEFLEKFFKKGNKINYAVKEGLENQDRIVSVSFDEIKKEIILWCDTDKITQTEMLFEELNEVEE